MAPFPPTPPRVLLPSQHLAGGCCEPQRWAVVLVSPRPAAAGVAELPPGAPTPQLNWVHPGGAQLPCRAQGVGMLPMGDPPDHSPGTQTHPAAPLGGRGVLGARGWCGVCGLLSPQLWAGDRVAGSIPPVPQAPHPSWERGRGRGCAWGSGEGVLLVGGGRTHIRAGGLLVGVKCSSWLCQLW